MPVWLVTAVASKWFKIGLGVAALLALAGIVYATVRTIKDWETSVYNNGFSAGSDMQEKRWQTASAQAAQKQVAQLANDAVASNNAVKSYLAEIANRAPLLVPVKERTVVYEKSPVGTLVCLDPDGVKLWEDYRAASGLGGTATPAKPGASPVR